MSMDTRTDWPTIWRKKNWSAPTAFGCRHRARSSCLKPWMNRTFLPIASNIKEKARVSRLP
eukprot:scaffold381140_cov24-Attheya_sp.AAC.1